MNILSKYTTRAFSLIEAAVTMSIMGLATSAIWLAYTTTSEAVKVDEFVRNFLVTRNNIERLFTGHPDMVTTSFANADAWEMGFYNGVTGWNYNGTNIRDQWGNTVIFQQFRVTAGKLEYLFRAQNLPDSSCIKIVNRITAIAPEKFVRLGGGSVNITTFPVRPTAAECQQTAAGNKILNLQMQYLPSQ